MQALYRTKVLLKKAQKLADLIESNEELDRPERDLMLAYLRDLHDIFASDTEYLVNNAPHEVVPVNIPPLRQEPPPPASADPRPEPVVVQIPEKEETAKDNAPPTNGGQSGGHKDIQNGVQNTWDTLLDAAERFLERHDTPKPNVVLHEITEMPPLTKPEPTPEPKPTAIPIKNYVSDNHDDDAMPVVIEPVKTPAIEPTTEKKTGAALIFDVKSTNSDMGSDKPIKDFRMAFGINERIFNINELFGNSASVYDATLNELNAMSSFEDAKAYLETHIITQYAWEKPEKIKKAQWFARLLWRRFL
jgi:hypothetical protein